MNGAATLAFVAALAVLSASKPAVASCDLRITGAGPCRPDGAAGNPLVGEPYALRVNVRVTGVPSAPFRIRWKIAANTHDFAAISVGEGDFTWTFRRQVALDGPMPWSVSIDPEHVSGDTDWSNNAAAGKLTPTPPKAAMENYEPRIMRGWEEIAVRYAPDSGAIGWLDFCFGLPTTHTTQEVLEAPGPAGGIAVTTSPFGLPASEIARRNPSPRAFQDAQSFTVRLWNVRVNPGKLRRAGWAGLGKLKPEIARWTQSEAEIQSAHAEIAAFAAASLPTGFRKAIAPYDAARVLHQAVMKHMTYTLKHPGDGALGALRNGWGDCGYYSYLLIACLRNIGIPARPTAGWWEGTNQWHMWVELYLPGGGWIVADPTVGDQESPDGLYAYQFGYVPNANSRCSVTLAATNIMPSHAYGHLQVPNWYWSGTAKWLGTEHQCRLLPAPKEADTGTP
jgi:hypothetical protein